MSKQCRKCNQHKEKTEFYSSKKNSDGLHSWCKSCSHNNTKRHRLENPGSAYKASKKWIKRNPEQVEDNRLRYHYGIGLGEYKEILQKQTGTCAICKKTHHKMCVDHCHITNKVRGILCDPCNKALGLFRDDPSLCEETTRYLKNSPTDS